MLLHIAQGIAQRQLAVQPPVRAGRGLGVQMLTHDQAEQLEQAALHGQLEALRAVCHRREQAGQHAVELVDAARHPDEQRVLAVQDPVHRPADAGAALQQLFQIEH